VGLAGAEVEKCEIRRSQQKKDSKQHAWRVRKTLGFRVGIWR